MCVVAGEREREIFNPEATNGLGGPLRQIKWQSRDPRNLCLHMHMTQISLKPRTPPEGSIPLIWQRGGLNRLKRFSDM